MARRVGERIGSELDIPIFHYEHAATSPERRNLAQVRSGEYEGMAEKLKARGNDVKTHWRHFTDVLDKRGLVTGFDYAPRGYSYYLRGNVDVVRIDNAFITGDAVGLATRDLCEGIGPAIRSGHLAAESILTGSEYSLDAINALSAEHAIVRKLLEYMFVKRRTRPSKHSRSTDIRQQAR